MLTYLHVLRDKLITTKLICISGKVYIFKHFYAKKFGYIYITETEKNEVGTTSYYYDGDRDRRVQSVIDDLMR